MNGILIVDKPQGWTSHDVVNFIRKRFDIEKAGHAGTLDPMATGVLVVLLGNNTKFSAQLMNTQKEYKATVTLGKITDTQDATGIVLKEEAPPRLSQEAIEKAFAKFTGEIEQVPPMYSALKVSGQKLCDLARKNKEVKRSPRKIIIDKIELESFNPAGISVTVTCQKGAYIRTLCQDLAEELGCLGYLSYLRRTRSGRFGVAQAVCIDTLKRISKEDLKNLIVENAQENSCRDRRV